MLPIFLDLSRLHLVLVGNGPAALRRLHLLEEAGAREIEIFAAAPVAALAEAAGARLIARWPAAAELARANFVFIADAPAGTRERLAGVARAAGVLVHVEDAPALSDAQAPAVLRRGALTLAVSTGGGSPALAAQVRDYLGEVIGPEWAPRLEEMSRLRRAWRAAGVAPSRIARLSADWMKSHGWLDDHPPPGATRN